MHESSIELASVTRRCDEALDGWKLRNNERQNVLTCDIASNEAGAAVALETRLRYIVDIDQTGRALLGEGLLLPIWLRVPQTVFGGMSPLELMVSHVNGLRLVRLTLVREQLDRVVC